MLVFPNHPQKGSLYELAASGLIPHIVSVRTWVVTSPGAGRVGALRMPKHASWPNPAHLPSQWQAEEFLGAFRKVKHLGRVVTLQDCLSFAPLVLSVVAWFLACVGVAGVICRSLIHS